MNTPLSVRRLGEQPYAPVFAAMREYTDGRGSDSADEFWFVQHPPVFTQGQAGKAEHILAPGSIPVVKVDRGGQVTYHGPGQLVVYVLIDLKRMGMHVRQLVSAIEQSIVELLCGYHIQAAARAHAPGVYVDDAKIASLGLRVRKGCSYHGLALNVDMDLTPFERINPCGYQGLRMTQIKDVLPAHCEAPMADVEQALLARLVANLGFQTWHEDSDPLAVLVAGARQ